MKKRVALISPNLNGTPNGVNRIQPSHPLCLFATILREKGYEVFVRDTALEGYENQIMRDDGKTVVIGESDEQIVTWLSEIRPDFVGISVLFSNLAPHAWNVGSLARRVNPDVKVIVGGNHVSNAVSDFLYYRAHPHPKVADPIAFLRSGAVDYAMWGECDRAFPRLLDALSSGGDAAGMPGAVYFDGKDYHVSPKSDKVMDLDALPPEDRDFVNMEAYFRIGRFHSPKGADRVGNVRGSRGCPEKCRFCTSPTLFGAPIRWRSPRRVYEEIAILKDKYNVEEIQFEDDSLTANKTWLLELCDLIKPLGLRWCTPNGLKINYYAHNPDLQRRMFEAMRDSGCYQISFGVESGVQDVLDNIIDKRLKLEVVAPTIEIVKSTGMLVHCFYMVGFPGETREQMEATVEFAAASGSDSFSLAIFSPLPGTVLLREIYEKELWWDPKSTPENTLFTRSLVQADGFSGPEEFENWVGEKSVYLNSLLKERDPERFAYKYGCDTTDEDLKHQT
ncbi:MAG: radical SAM protein [Phycisphaerae bacterium]|nr:radical SAM protein [Planctomycetota bacterium]MBL7220590.1 radical SAM protein [Phycisphaerae bacterium]